MVLSFDFDEQAGRRPYLTGVNGKCLCNVAITGQMGMQLTRVFLWRAHRDKISGGASLQDFGHTGGEASLRRTRIGKIYEEIH